MRLIKTASEKLNLGCGNDAKDGYVNVDKFAFKGADIIWDMNKTPFPFKENSFSEIIMNHVLEHVEDVPKTMEEVWRISKPGALIFIGVPYFTGINAVKDPTHKHFFCVGTFEFFERGRLGNYFEELTKMNFKIIRKKIIYSNHRLLKIINPLLNLHQGIYERFFCYLLPAQVLEVTLKAIKQEG